MKSDAGNGRGPRAASVQSAVPRGPATPRPTAGGPSTSGQAKSGPRAPGKRAAAAPPPGTVVLGTVSRPNGLTGAVVVHLHPSMHDTVRRGLAVSLLRDGAAPLSSRVRSAGPVRGGLRVTFDGVADRNAAEALVGARVTVPRDELGPMDDDEFLDSDIVGLEAFSVDGARLGRVVEVVATGANDVWVVKADDGSEILVPAVAHAVDSVDLDAGRLTVVAEALEYGAPPAQDAKRAPQKDPAP